MAKSKKSDTFSFKRKASLLAISSACILALSACGGGGSSDDSGNTPPPGGGNNASRIVNPQVANVTGYVNEDNAVVIPFSTNTGTATNLRITSTLPAGWTSITQPNTTMCATVTTSTTACRLNITYRPTAATTTPGTMTINYSYTDSTGQSRTGTITFTYQAQVRTTPSSVVYITNRSNPGGVQRCTIEAQGALGNCEDAITGGTGTTVMADPSSIKVNGNYAYIVNVSNNSIHRCTISDTGELTSCDNSGAANINGPADIAFSGANAYITNSTNGNNTITRCAVAANTGALGNCATVAATNGTENWLFSQPISISISGTSAYIMNNGGDAAGGTVNRCSINAAGNFENCGRTATTGSNNANMAFPGAYGLTINGTRAYVVTREGGTNAEQPGTVTMCTVNGTSGALEACTSQVSSGLNAANRIAFSGNYAYITNRNSGQVAKCDVNNGALSNCTAASTVSFGQAAGIAIR